MSSLVENIRLSYHELRKVRTLTVTAFLVALGVLLGMVTLIPTQFLKIGVGYLVTATMGLLFGPVPALLGATAVDLIRYILRPSGPYFFGFTFNSALTGLLYGLFLYRRPIKLWRVLLAKATVSCIINVILTTVWLGVLYGKSITVLLPVRLIKNAASLPVESILLWAMLMAVQKVWSRLDKRGL